MPRYGAGAEEIKIARADVPRVVEQTLAERRTALAIAGPENLPTHEIERHPLVYRLDQRIGDDLAVALLPLGDLVTDLFLPDLAIGDDGATAIGEFTHLTHLDLAYNRIGSDGESSVIVAPSLEEPTPCFEKLTCEKNIVKVVVFPTIKAAIREFRRVCAF